MFEIEYKGGNCVAIDTKKTKLVVDPCLSLHGSKNANVKDAVVVGTESRFVVEQAGERMVLEGPGEYEVGDFSLRGIAARRHLDADDAKMTTTMYRIEIGEVSIALLGNIAPYLSEDQLEAIGVVDILIIPVGGGGYTLDATSAAMITRQIGPKVVMPVHYADKELKYQVPQDDVAVFVAEMGAPEELGAKYKVKGASSIPQVLTTVRLERS